MKLATDDRSIRSDDGVSPRTSNTSATGTEPARVDPERLAQVTTLAPGAHGPSDEARCALEAVAFIAHEPRTDQPACTSPTIAAFVGSWNDTLPQTDRDELILPLLPRLVGTRSSDAIERRRLAMAVDWLVRTHLPAWFHLARLDVEADEFEDLPELTDLADVAALCDHLKRARNRAAIGNLTLRTRGASVRAAAWDATHQAAWETVRDGLERAGPATLAAGWDAAYAAAYAAARACEKEEFEPTRSALQRSAVALVERMIDAPEPDSTDGEESGVELSAQHPSGGSPTHSPVGHETDARS